MLLTFRRTLEIAVPSSAICHPLTAAARRIALQRKRARRRNGGEGGKRYESRILL